MSEMQGDSEKSADVKFIKSFEEARDDVVNALEGMKACLFQDEPFTHLDQMQYNATVLLLLFYILSHWTHIHGDQCKSCVELFCCPDDKVLKTKVDFEFCERCGGNDDGDLTH